MTEIEKMLILKSQQGDVNSFEELISNYQLYAYNIAFQMLKHEEDAKDAAQDALIKVYKNIGQFQMDSKFSTWLYRIVINTCKDQLRSKKSQWMSIEDESSDAKEWIEKLPARESEQPDRQLEKKEVSERIMEAFNRLSPNHKSVLMLRDIQGMSYEEIGVIENCSVGTIKSRINRGRLILRDILLGDDFLKQEGVV